MITNKPSPAWCVLVYCTCWWIMDISIGAGLCRPFAYNWDRSIAGGKCGQLDPAYISIAALDILGDAMIIGKNTSPRSLEKSVQVD